MKTSILRDYLGEPCTRTETLMGARACAVVAASTRGHVALVQGLTLECSRCERRAEIVGTPGAYSLSGPLATEACS